MNTKPLHVRQESKSSGRVCCQCGGEHFYTLYTRPRPRGILRLKQCRHCGKRIHTQERILGSITDL